MNLSIKIVKELYYNEGLSAKKVGERLDVSVWQVIKFMSKNNLQRRTQAETRKIEYLAAPLSFTPKGVLVGNEIQLKTAGLMLYLGEGSKGKNGTLDIANSNPLIISVFLKTLRDIYCVSEKKLRILLYCYSNQNKLELVRFWSNLTDIPVKQFSKPYVRKDFELSKKNKMPYGLVHIRYNDKKLIQKIRNDIDELCKDLIRRDAGVVNRK